MTSARRPDGDTLDQYLNAIMLLDEGGKGEEAAAVRQGQIRPGGIIEQAQLESLRYWATAGLLSDEVWRFDGHTVEYSGEADIGKTKHGTKAKSVKAIDRYTLYNGFGTLTCYFPTSITYSEALRHMVNLVQQTLPPEQRIGKLCFDKEGWDVSLLRWLQAEHQIVPVTWVKNLTPNIQCLSEVPDEAFVPLKDAEMVIGKANKHQVHQVADTTIDLPHLGDSRVVILETEEQRRIGIYSAAPAPNEVPLSDQTCMTTTGILEAMRLQQHVENGFKVDVHEMKSDDLPTHKVFTVDQTELYDLDQAERKLQNAQKRQRRYTQEIEQVIPQVQEETNLDKHSINLLLNRANRLRDRAQREVDIYTAEIAQVQVNNEGVATLTTQRQSLDLRKLTLLTLFKTHALAALFILATQLGLGGFGPERLRREFLSFGDRVEFDPSQRIATVYASRFPRARTQQAYERLCSLLHDVPITLTRNGLNYRVRFSW